MIDLNELAQELYGEFGFDTCTFDEQAEILTIVSEKIDINLIK